jgi:murein DD-endopeptidase MepM/ murein hydrolase activator NlpD
MRTGCGEIWGVEMRSFLTGLIIGAGLTVASIFGYLDPLIEMARQELGIAPSDKEVTEIETVPSDVDIPQENVATGGSYLAAPYVCLGQHITNSPPVDEEGRLTEFSSHVVVSGVTLAAAPVSRACVSSGFGQRDGKLHKGVDYYSKIGAEVYAAGSGVILEALYRDDYGNMVLIDHGNGVYIRYAHLKSLVVEKGQEVDAGQHLGPMGMSAGYKIPLHLHMELLLGDYENPASSFGLTPEDILSYPAAN